MGEGIGVGFAKRDATPPIGTAMSGYVIREGGAVGVHDRLWARAVALDDGARRVVAVVLDVLGVDAALTRVVREGVRARRGLDPGDLVLAATHTHGGPALLPSALLGTVAPGTREAVAAAAVDAASAALDDVREAEVAFAVGREATVARNRRVPGGPIDPEVPALVFRRGGVPVGVVTSYACHPVVLGPDNHRFTRDYPGYLLDAVEERWPGCIALFLSGCSGQVNSGHLASASLTGEPTASRTFEVAQDLGERLAGAALAAIDRGARPVRATPLRVARARVRLPLGPPPTDPAADLATWRAELASLGTADADRRAILRALVTWAERIAGAPAADVEVEVACWGLGELALAWFPGEVFVEHGLELKADDGRGTLVTVANALDAPGYLPHASAYPAGGYEVAEAFRFYGRPGPYRPEAGEAVGAAMRALLQEVRA